MWCWVLLKVFLYLPKQICCIILNIWMSEGIQIVYIYYYLWMMLGVLRSVDRRFLSRLPVWVCDCQKTFTMPAINCRPKCPSNDQISIIGVFCFLGNRSCEAHPVEIEEVFKLCSPIAEWCHTTCDMFSTQELKFEISGIWMYFSFYVDFFHSFSSWLHTEVEKFKQLVCQHS